MTINVLFAKKDITEEEAKHELHITLKLRSR